MKIHEYQAKEILRASAFLFQKVGWPNLLKKPEELPKRSERRPLL